MPQPPDAGRPPFDADSLPPDVEGESLVSSLQAVLRGYGREADADELATCLGVSFMAAASSTVDAIPLWRTMARHAFLTSTAGSYGLRLRGLHPAAAAILPPPPPEFAIHFRDAYLPFVEAALRQGTPVLAWGGWPEPAAHAWGVLTAFDGATGRCQGCVGGKDGPVIPLASPPAHVYIVDEYTDQFRDITRLITMAMHRAAIVFANQMNPAFHVVTGPDAFMHWRERLIGNGTLGPTRAMSAEDLLALVGSVIRGRMAALRFFEQTQIAADPMQAAVIAVYSRWFREMLACLTPLCEAGYVRAKMDLETGRRDLAAILAQAAEIERSTDELATEH